VPQPTVTSTSVGGHEPTHSQAHLVHLHRHWYPLTTRSTKNLWLQTHLRDEWISALHDHPDEPLKARIQAVLTVGRYENHRHQLAISRARTKCNLDRSEGWTHCRSHFAWRHLAPSYPQAHFWQIIHHLSSDPTTCRVTPATDTSTTQATSRQPYPAALTRSAPWAVAHGY
jgi:hypothetical protein